MEGFSWVYSILNIQFCLFFVSDVLGHIQEKTLFISLFVSVSISNASCCNKQYQNSGFRQSDLFCSHCKMPVWKLLSGSLLLTIGLRRKDFSHHLSSQPSPPKTLKWAKWESGETHRGKVLGSPGLTGAHSHPPKFLSPKTVTWSKTKLQGGWEIFWGRKGKYLVSTGLYLGCFPSPQASPSPQLHIFSGGGDHVPGLPKECLPSANYNHWFFRLISVALGRMFCFCFCFFRLPGKFILIYSRYWTLEYTPFHPNS